MDLPLHPARGAYRLLLLQQLALRVLLGLSVVMPIAHWLLASAGHTWLPYVMWFLITVSYPAVIPSPVQPPPTVVLSLWSRAKLTVLPLLDYVPDVVGWVSNFRIPDAWLYYKSCIGDVYYVVCHPIQFISERTPPLFTDVVVEHPMVVPEYTVSGTVVFFAWSVFFLTLAACLRHVSICVVTKPMSQPADSLRDSYRNYVFPPMPRKNRHPHPVANAHRNMYDVGINQWIRNLGLTPYVWQWSQRDVKAGVIGCHRHYWPVDTYIRERIDPIPHDAIHKMTNVDYYVDWRDYLWMFQPFVLYTFTPAAPSGATDEYTWTTNDDEITMIVKGGGKYVHKLWDYSREAVSYKYGPQLLSYKVDTRNFGDFSCVLLTPMSVTTEGEEQPFQRRKITYSYATVESATPRAVNSTRAFHKDSWGYWLNQPASPSSAFVPDNVWAALKARASLPKMERQDFAILLKNCGKPDLLSEPIVVACFPADSSVPFSTTKPLTEAEAAVAYYKTDNSVLQKVKPAGRVVGPVLADGAFCPANCKTNDEWCVKERVLDMRNPQVALPAKYSAYADEFVDLVMPNSLTPINMDAVKASQTKPQQINKNARASLRLGQWLASLWGGMVVLVKAFQKAEFYPAMKPPRNISTVPAEHCLLYSQYTQAITSELKTQPWYAFSKHPDRVADRMHELGVAHAELTSSDFTRLDGSKSRALGTDLEQRIAKKAFPGDDTMVKLHTCLQDANAITRNGVSYEVEGSRLSGEAGTSLYNTLINAFVAYCTFREMGYTALAAFKMLGIYGGDDGVTGSINKPTYERVAGEMGLTLKAETTKSNEPTGFLGRVYPDPSAGPQHMADIRRQLVKLHASTATVSVDDDTALYNKASGLVATDPITPLLGAWAIAMLRITGIRREVPELATDLWRSYKIHGPSDDLKYTPSEDQRYTYASMALGLDVSTIKRYEKQMEEAKQLSDFPTHIIPIDVELPDGVVFRHRLGATSAKSLNIAPCNLNPQKLSSTIPDSPALTLVKPMPIASSKVSIPETTRSNTNSTAARAPPTQAAEQKVNQAVRPAPTAAKKKLTNTSPDHSGSVNPKSNSVPNACHDSSKQGQNPSPSSTTSPSTRGALSCRTCKRKAGQGLLNLETQPCAKPSVENCRYMGTKKSQPSVGLPGPAVNAGSPASPSVSASSSPQSALVVGSCSSLACGRSDCANCSAATAQQTLKSKNTSSLPLD